MSFLKTLVGLISDTETRVARIDSYTNSLKVADTQESSIADGHRYMIAGYQDNFDTNDVIDFVVTTPNSDMWLHMEFYISGFKYLQMEIYEGATGVTGGATATPINMNRNSTNTSVATVLANPTITSDGSLIFSQAITTNKAGGTIRKEGKIILKQNQTYVFRFTSQEDNNIISYIGQWSEMAAID